MRWRKTDVCRENTDVRWVGFHPLHTACLVCLLRCRRKKAKLAQTNLECYITLGRKGLPDTKCSSLLAHSLVMMEM
jgi:hypothetical protein